MVVQLKSLDVRQPKNMSMGVAPASWHMLCLAPLLLALVVKESLDMIVRMFVHSHMYVCSGVNMAHAVSVFADVMSA